MDLNQSLAAILQCLSDISVKHYYGSETLIDVLRGDAGVEKKSPDLMFVEGFGKLNEIERNDLHFIIEWLIAKGFIRRTKERNPVLHPTYNGIHYSETMNESLLKELRGQLEKTELQNSSGEISV